MVGRVVVSTVLALNTEELSLIEIRSGAVAADASGAVEVRSLGRAVDSVLVGEWSGVNNRSVVDRIGAVVIIAVVIGAVVVASSTVAALIAGGVEDGVGLHTVNASLSIEEWSLWRAWY